VIQRITQAGVGRGELGVEFDGLLPAGDGRVQLAVVSQRNAQAVVGPGELRVEREGLLEAGDGLVHVALVSQRNAQVVVGPRLSGRKATAALRKRTASARSGGVTCRSTDLKSWLTQESAGYCRWTRRNSSAA
jgi:hypothetical protein